MSDLPAGALGYQAVVGEFFLALRGSGLLLSPLDQELVAEWERRGLPVPVVCRGVRRGLAQVAAEKAVAVRSLRQLRFAVEDEWRAYQSGRVGDAPAPPGEADAAARRLAEAREQLTQGAARAGRLRTVYRAAWRVLLDEGAFPGSPLERAEAAILAADARLFSGWLASLPRPERAALGARARLLAGGRRRGESLRAYRGTLRAHLLDLARQAGLTCLSGVS
jgi:hypothetical protein